MSYPPPYPPPPDNSGTLRGINVGVWILVFVFVILPILAVLCCCLGPTLLGMIGAVTGGTTTP